MLPTIAGALGFLLAPTDAYVGRLICFYLTGSYQASFVIFLSVITSNTAGQTKKMLVSGTIWFGACVGNIASPFVSLALPNNRFPSSHWPQFYKTDQAPTYHLGIGSLLVANCLELGLFIAFRYAFIWENKKKQRRLANGDFPQQSINATAFADLTDKQNPK
jgi:hypothetical protein